MGYYWCRLVVLYNKHYLYIIDYYSEFPVITKREGFSVYNLNFSMPSHFAEYEFTRIMSETGI